ncbi:NADH dehydrogenase [ubiquinone] 1 beta subcomplex subunit 1 [Copidosoma floridanum]|uniref:NADH dehydrogenase [ubiquinone] 1 beta subcomplex subunit 1 n=1 Tax=Copidosoma floridanum TaxID=29053 RepID=UPI0006C9666A|nr:NADH dehydrogenase [ubiquinone] 1 beta subcomplex subunit 1 [Copidosoma floridanum]
MKIITKDIKVIKSQFRKNYLLMLIPLAGMFIGHQLDKIEDERMSKFRDKTALYKRDVPPAKPSW